MVRFAAVPLQRKIACGQLEKFVLQVLAPKVFCSCFEIVCIKLVFYLGDAICASHAAAAAHAKCTHAVDDFCEIINN